MPEAGQSRGHAAVDLAGPALEVRAFAGRGPARVRLARGAEASRVQRADDLPRARSARLGARARARVNGDRQSGCSTSRCKPTRASGGSWSRPSRPAAAEDGSLRGRDPRLERDFPVAARSAFGEQQPRAGESRRKHDLLGRQWGRSRSSRTIASATREGEGSARCARRGPERGVWPSCARATKHPRPGRRAARCCAGPDRGPGARRGPGRPAPSFRSRTRSCGAALAGRLPDRVGIRAVVPARARRRALRRPGGAALARAPPRAETPHELFRVRSRLRFADRRPGRRRAAARVEVLAWNPSGALGSTSCFPRRGGSMTQAVRPRGRRSTRGRLAGS
jgi:hypothetical protein